VTSAAHRVRRVPTGELTSVDVAALRSLLWAAFPPEDEEGFTEEDWEHALGGWHFVIDDDRAIVAHAAVVEREIQVGGRPLRTGYVEAVATEPGRQGRGLGSLVMGAATEHIRDTFELGILGTGRQGFYERLGWFTWRGPSAVRTEAGLVRTPDDDGFIMALRTRTSPPLDPDSPISCDFRPGDVW
jgi:aminoglycoside 2'-N-acetyltransferase I